MGLGSLRDAGVRGAGHTGAPRGATGMWRLRGGVVAPPRPVGKRGQQNPTACGTAFYGVPQPRSPRPR